MSAGSTGAEDTPAPAGKSKFFGDTVRAAGGTVVVFMARFFTLAILARTLGVEQFGIIALAILSVDLLSLLLLGGLPGVMSRFLPLTDKASRPKLLALRRRWAGISLVLMALVAPVVGWTLLDFGTLPMVLFAIWVCANAAHLITIAEMQGALRFDLVFWTYLAGSTLQVTGALLLTLSPSINGGMLVLLIPPIVQLLPWFIAFRGRFQGPEGSGTLPPLREIAGYGFNFCLIAALTAIVWSRGELFVVKEQLGETSLGHYSAAVTLSAMVWRLTGLLQGAVTPHLVHRLESDEGIGPFVDQMTRLVMMISTVGTLAIVFFATEFVTLIFGVDFAQAAPIITVMTPGIVTAGLSSAQIGVQLMSNGRVPRNALVVGALMLIALAFMLSGPLGSEGIALARSLTMLGVSLVMPLWLMANLKGRAPRSVLMELFLSVGLVTIAALVMLTMDLDLWLRILIWSLLAYVWAARGTGELLPQKMAASTVRTLRSI